MHTRVLLIYFLELEDSHLVKGMEEFDQLIVEIVSIDLVVETKGLPGAFLISTLKNWKSDLKKMFPGKDLMYIEKDDPRNGSPFEVDLSALEDDLCFDFPCLNDQNVVVRNPVKNYMKFRSSITIRPERRMPL